MCPNFLSLIAIYSVFCAQFHYNAALSVTFSTPSYKTFQFQLFSVLTLNHVYNAWLYSVFSVNGTCTKLIYEGQCQGFLPDYLPNTEKNLVDLGLSDNKISKRYVLKRLNLNIKIA